MAIERMRADELAAAMRHAKLHGVSVSAAITALREKLVPDVVAAPHLTPAQAGLLEVLAGDLPEATEDQVSAEVMAALAQQHGAKLLEHYQPGEIRKGSVVLLTSEHKARPRGISKGWPDLAIARAGVWGWLGVELKARSSKGRCAGRPSPEQRAAIDAGLYHLAWAPGHVLWLIDQADKQAGR